MKQKRFITILLSIILCSFCYSIAYAINVNINVVKNKSNFDVSIIPFNEQIYSLALKTFLANGNLHEAYIVAKAAVQQEPDNFKWRENYAQIATWTNRPKIALQQYIFLAKNQHNVDAMTKGIKIAGMLNDHTTLVELFNLKIKYGGGKPDAWKGYVAAQEALGDPNKAIQQLLITIKTEPKLYHFETLVNLYRSTGNVQAEIDTLDQIEKRFGVIPKFTIIQAELLYSQGKIKQAHAQLAKAVKKATDKDIAFWRSFGQLSWMMQDKKDALKAYTKLNESGKIDPESLMHLIQITEETNTKQAYILALQGWQKFKSDFFILKILEYAPSLHQWTQLSSILSNLPPDVAGRLNNLPYFISVKAQLLAYFGKRNVALALYQQALKNLPESSILKTDYMWFLIDHKYTEQLSLALAKWHTELTTNVELIPVFAAGYVAIKKHQIALKLLQSQFAANKDNAKWLNDVADILEQANQPTKAIAMRKLAWYKILKALSRKEIDLTTQKDLNNFARIAMHNANGDVIAKTIIQLAKYAPKYPEANNNLIALALQANEYQLANYQWHKYGQAQNVEAWMQQSVALRNNDKTQLQALLTHNVDQLPYRDRVTAAQRVGNENLAQSLAFQGLKDHPNDSEMYQLMKETQLKSADKIDIDTAYKQVGYIRGPEIRLQGLHATTPKTSFSLMGKVWDTRTTDKTQIKAATRYDRTLEGQITRRYRKGIVGFYVGYRNALDNFMTSQFIGTYRLTNKLNSILTLQYNQPADETTALLIAGMQDEIKLDFQYQVTNRDYLSLETFYRRFSSQDSTHMGNAMSYRGIYDHKFEFGYLDWNGGIFASIHQFQHTGTLSSTAQEIIPDGQTADLYFYIPRNYTRYGIHFGFGQAYREVYTHAWRPFAEVIAFNNTRFGYGSYLDLGIAGHVFGRDHLAFYYHRGLNVEGTDQIDYTFGLDYNMYF